MSTLLLTSSLLFQLVSSHGSGGKAGAPGAAPASDVRTVAGLAWTPPRGWSVAPSASAMRVVTYHVAAASGDPEPAEVAVFFFGPGQGGAVDLNVDRWVHQFEPEGPGVKANLEKRKAGDLPVTFVTMEGTYASGMPGGPLTPRRGWALRGAIAEGPQGNVFFKMTGPKKTIAAAAASFDELLKSLKRSG